MKIVTIQEVSEFLKVKKSTIYSWVNQKRIPSFKLNGLWRFDMDKIEEWVKASYGLKVVPQRITKKKSGNKDIDRIVKHAIEEIYGKE
ncbi:MAG: helix-turn-helix domain-containing protein [Candidatus Brocadia sp.]|nr:helix-turn-helix domain-containing protein [Candidatus Brocadia sp.]